MALLVRPPPPPSASLATAIDAVMYRAVRAPNLLNLAVWATFPLVGALIVEAWAARRSRAPRTRLIFAGLVFAVFMITNFLNFVMVAGSLQRSREVSFRESLTSVYVTVSRRNSPRRC